MKCIIIDDEPLAVQLISDYLNNIPQLEIVARFNNPIEALTFLQNNSIDLMFLDIQMPLVTGIDLIKSLQSKPMVIFTTAYAQYALESYELDVIDYLLKPFTFIRFLQAVNKALERKSIKPRPSVSQDIPPTDQMQKRFLFVKHGYKSVRIDFGEILFIEGLKEYVTIYTADKKVVKYETMKNLEDTLPSDEFLRVHKSYIVALKKIEAFYGNVIEMKGHEIPIGRSYRENVMKVLSE